MLVVLAAIVGCLTSGPSWWWLPASAGMLGEVAHFASSHDYRKTLRTDEALAAAAVAMTLLTAACLVAFAGGRLLAGTL